MRGPTDTKDVMVEIEELKEQNSQLRAQLADLLDENHELSEQNERQLNYIAELESDVADLKASIAGKDMAG